MRSPAIPTIGLITLERARLLQDGVRAGCSCRRT